MKTVNIKEGDGNVSTQSIYKVDCDRNIIKLFKMEQLMTEKELEIQKSLGLVPKGAFLYLCNNIHHNHHGYGRDSNITPHITITPHIPPFQFAHTHCLFCKSGFYHGQGTQLTVSICGDNDD